jgi:hypothetical protein
MTRGQGRGTEICYNVQTAVDAKHKLIVACDVTNNPCNRDWRSPSALEAKAVLGCRFAAVADVGSYHGHKVNTCVEVSITPYVVRPINSANGELGLFSKDAFTYDRAMDTCPCPTTAATPGMDAPMAKLPTDDPVRNECV